MQRLSCPAYSPDMSPIEHVWDLFGRCLARDLRPAASKDELLLRIQAIWRVQRVANKHKPINLISTHERNTYAAGRCVIDGPYVNIRIQSRGSAKCGTMFQ
ncbi:hypothetical protein TNCV_4906101 [Trichonephila clavipes]|uniref:Uncharacterized protein n=1 Tax=Trichonephila clavipes TaxID=2585209 RepID=A0A8X6RSB2_TRICX|nr:hypothetical protein TNCV_4906101 [Trichonephila clavipes]